ncbi:fructose transport system ATP-binding protein [Actinacidiphila yanglinensis]|uniref:Fructose transport system ATP-binding protein n=1 Tax=Actinacidiphila yanglinensis TaxID=310779 RepID=A0A1H5SWG0_9ACTN|nr:ATP-binding cassette domain-containing protein [Actinacidiphila yanglinensis]SEF54880.1 fructose transport system ATP-binding protein [Actinacidiphila yanglinensis]
MNGGNGNRTAGADQDAAAVPRADVLPAGGATPEGEPRCVLRATGLVKRYGNVVAIRASDFDLRAGEVLAVVGDNGAGKSSLIKALSGALVPDAGVIELDGRPVAFRSPHEAREAGIETVYQTLAMAPQMDIAANLYLGRPLRRAGTLGLLRMLDHRRMREEAARQLDALGIATVQDIGQVVGSLSGGQRQAVAVARAAMFGSRVIIMDEPTAALGVRESRQVLELIARIRDRGVPVVLISHDMPQVFEIADRIHIHRLGRRTAVVEPARCSMTEVVGLMTGALRVTEDGTITEQALSAPHRKEGTA